MLCISLVAGILSTVAGYIGCFYLIQNSLDSTGPLLWLILEHCYPLLGLLFGQSTRPGMTQRALSLSYNLPLTHL